MTGACTVQFQHAHLQDNALHSIIPHCGGSWFSVECSFQINTDCQAALEEITRLLAHNRDTSLLYHVITWFTTRHACV